MFQLIESTEVRVVSVTNRIEKHGDDSKPAVSLGLELTDANTSLDIIDPKPEAQELPLLPEAQHEISYQRPSGQWGRLEGYTAVDMRAYARAAIAKALQSQFKPVELLSEEIVSELRARTGLIPGHNVDRIDVAAGLRELAACGYEDSRTTYIIEFALMRWARGEEEHAQRGAIDRAFHGIDLTSWFRVLAAARASAEAMADSQGGEK